MVTGVEKGKLQMEDYNPEWEKAGRNTVELLRKNMPGAIDIKHVGSTAIKGMFAKPLIDIAVLVDDLDIVETWVEPLKAQGFFYGGEVIEGCREFGKDNPDTGNREVHVHIVPEGNERWDGYLYTVEYCNEFPNERDAYANLKHDLVTKYANDPSKYNPAKDEFMKALQERAFAWKKKKAPILMRLKNQALDYPDRVAVCDMYGDGDCYRETTYKHLYELAGRVSTKLKSQGVKRGTPVIVRMDRRVEYIAALYGILMARGVVIPAVPSYPDSRIEDMKSDSGANLVLTESFYEDIDKYEASAAVHIADQEVVWMNYTSGSTAKPKGVVYTYKAVDSGIASAGTAFFEGLDTLNHASTIALSFAAAAWDVYSLLYLGGTLHLISEDARKDTKLIARYIEEHQVKSVSISPSMLRFFEAPSCIKRVYATGQRVINAYSDKYETWGAYGCTECFTACLGFPIDKNYENTPVGKPVGDFDAAILDDKGNSLAAMEEGEIAIFGYTAEGYRGLKEATEAAFTDLGNGKHRYMTGDLGYMDKNGNIVLLNRKDWMVKISGQRVDPAEIERAIRAVEGVGDCVVKAFTKDSGDAFLCAYYTASEDIPREKLLEKVTAELPPYMSPAYTVRLDAIPLTVSGKYDQTKLEDPRKTLVSADYEAPKNDIEQLVCSAMENVLGYPRVGRKDDFFKIGGDSLAVLALISEINEDSLLAADIYTARTPEAIAVVISKHHSDASKIQWTRDAIEESKSKPHKLSPLQNHYYRYKKMLPAEPIGNTAFLAEWDKTKYTPAMLAEATDVVISKYAVFSSKIVEDESGEAYLQYVDTVLPKTQVIELSDQEFEEVTADLIQSFDIVNGPLFRFRVYNTETRLLLFADMHHTISDATSQIVLMQAISSVLNKEALSEDFYFLARDHENSSLRIRELPKDYSVLPSYDMEPTSCTCDSVILETDASLDEITNKLAKLNISISEFFAACAIKALAEHESNDKISTEIMTSSRNSSIAQKLVGMAIYTCPIDVEITSGEDFTTYISRAAKIIRDSKLATTITANNWHRPMLDDVMIINYIPNANASGYDWHKIDLINSNRYSMNSMQVIARENAPDAPLRLLFLYNDTAYKRSSVERYVKTFMELFRQI